MCWVRGLSRGWEGRGPPPLPPCWIALTWRGSFIGESREPSIQQEEGSKQQEERAAKETA